MEIGILANISAAFANRFHLLLGLGLIRRTIRTGLDYQSEAQHYTLFKLFLDNKWRKMCEYLYLAFECFLLLGCSLCHL